jgi:hypothetical protein
VQLVTTQGATEFGQGEAHLDRILEGLALYEAAAPARPLPMPGEFERVISVRLDAPATQFDSRGLTVMRGNA